MRIANLDLLRAIAVLMVVAYHMQALNVVTWPRGLNVFVNGWIGCDLFFVLSGWLVGRSLWAELQARQTLDLARFYGRRFSRMLPPYYIALIPIALAEYFTNASQGVLFDWRCLFLIQNLWGQNPIFAPAWFICVLFQCYLLLPPLFMLLFKRRGLLDWGLPLMFFLPLALRLLILPTDITGLNYRATYFHSEGLILGLWLAYLDCFHPALSLRLAAVARRVWPFALLVVCWPFTAGFYHHYFYTLGAVCFAVILLAVASGSPLTLARTAGVGVIAASAYSIYLTHGAALHFYLRFLQPFVHAQSAWLRGAVALLVVGVIGLIFHRFVERPCEKIRIGRASV